MKALPLLLAVFALLLAAIAGLGVTPSSESHPTSAFPFPSADLSPADRKLTLEMFAFQARLEDVGDMSLQLVPFYSSPVGLERTHPALHEYYNRGRNLFESHLRLLERDEDYRRRFRQAEARLVEQLGEHTSMRAGRTATYPLLLSAGVIGDIVAATGPSAVRAVPAESARDPLGRDDRPFVRGAPPAQIRVYPASVLPFHYCSGLRDTAGHGITITGGEENPFVAAHRRLYENDTDYRARFDATVKPFALRAAETDPLDVKAGWRLTTELRDALVETGISDRIQRRAAEPEG